MSKRLPFFQFEPAEYLTKDVSFCSISAQGLFINICAYYWQRDCNLTKSQLLRRLPFETELKELISEGIIDLIDNNISVKFLDNQMSKAITFSKLQSEKGKKGGRPKKAKRKPNESQTKAKRKPNESHNIREDDIIQDNTKEDNKETLIKNFKNIPKEKQTEIVQIVLFLNSECTGIITTENELQTMKAVLKIFKGKLQEIKTEKTGAFSKLESSEIIESFKYIINNAEPFHRKQLTADYLKKYLQKFISNEMYKPETKVKEIKIKI